MSSEISKKVKGCYPCKLMAAHFWGDKGRQCAVNVAETLRPESVSLMCEECKKLSGRGPFGGLAGHE
jgi:hypothetical protein